MSIVNIMMKDGCSLSTRLGYSKKGYIDGSIGVEWIKQFDKHTKAKAGGRRRLLLVDGHASHYTFAFLDYARQSNIHVLCYPSHSTHALQGLDVVVFSMLKRHWRDARDTFERETGTRVKKTNFLSVYATAHARALTPETVKAAFRKTGVVPYNPDVITAAMMAPSLESSVHGTLPLPQASAVQALSEVLIGGTHQHIAGSATRSAVVADPVHTPPRTLPDPRAHTALLTSTSASNLVSPSRILPAATPPRYIPVVISPMKRRYEALLQEEPLTSLEVRLQKALAESEGRDTSRKVAMVGMQAATVLQNMYVERVQGQLQAQEEKGGKKKRKLLGDGLPRLMDGDEFFLKVREVEASQEQEKAEKDARKAEKDRYDKEMDAWKVAEKARKQRVAAQREQYHKALTEWEQERALAKKEHRRATLGKPLLGKIEAALPKPKLSALGRKAEEEGEVGEDELEDENENDIDV